MGRPPHKYKQKFRKLHFASANGEHMDRMISRPTLRAAVLSALFLASVSLTFGQRAGDENFESPTPVLLTEASTTRALAQPAGRGIDLRSLSGRSAFRPGTRIELFVSNLSLLPGE